MLFNVFKFIHITAAMIWIGGAVTLVIINARLARFKNQAALEALAQQSGFYGRAVLGPAAGTTLVAGGITAALMHINFGSLWILWGFAGIFGSMLIGGVLIRRASEALGRLAAAPAPDRPGMQALQRRLATLNLVNILLLLSVVSAMVFKPLL